MGSGRLGSFGQVLTQSLCRALPCPALQESPKQAMVLILSFISFLHKVYSGPPHHYSNPSLAHGQTCLQHAHPKTKSKKPKFNPVLLCIYFPMPILSLIDTLEKQIYIHFLSSDSHTSMAKWPPLCLPISGIGQ